MRGHSNMRAYEDMTLTSDTANMRHADTYVAYEDMTLTSDTTSTTSCLLPYAFYTWLTYALCLIPHRRQAILLQPRHGAANGGR